MTEIKKKVRQWLRRREKPDPTPMAIPIGFERPPTLAEQVARLVRNERLQAALSASGRETFEEANDFDVGDDFDPSSPYEENFHGKWDEEVKLEAERNKREAEAAEARKKAIKRPKGSSFEEEVPIERKAKSKPKDVREDD